MSESIIEGRGAVDGPGRIALPAAFAAILAAGLAAWGTYGESDPSTGEYLVLLGIIAVATAVVFGWVVPRALRRESAGTTALVLSVLGLATIAVFWTGLPPVLAMGAVVLGWARRSAGLPRAAAVLGVLAIAADVAVYVQDMAF